MIQLVQRDNNSKIYKKYVKIRVGAAGEVELSECLYVVTILVTQRLC